MAALLFLWSHPSAAQVPVGGEVVIASYTCEQSATAVTRQIEFDGTILQRADPLLVQATTSPTTGTARGMCLQQTDDVIAEGKKLGCTAGPLVDADAITFTRSVQLVCAGARERVVLVIARLSDIVINTPRPLTTLRR